MRAEHCARHRLAMAASLSRHSPAALMAPPVEPPRFYRSAHHHNVNSEGIIPISGIT
jgi:hypothetical protein